MSRTTYIKSLLLATILSGTVSLEGYATGILTSDYVGSTSNTGFVFVTNNIQQMVLDTNGNLGLGIGNPGAYKFYANGPSFFA